MKPSPAEETFESRYGVPSSESAVPAVRDAAYATLRQAAPKSVGFMGWLKGAALVLGVMYAIGWASTTLIVAGANKLVWHQTMTSHTYERTATAEVARPYALAPDPGITPEQAGRAYRALQSRDLRSGDFRVRGMADRPDAPWRHWGNLDPSLFASSNRGSNLPLSTKIIASAAAGELKPRELEMLRQIATAPIWKDFEIVARAPAIDVVGAQFELPFGATENVVMMPLPRFADSRELAIAGVARAAWYVTQGQPGKAEAVLRGVLSFGFVMSDNAVTTIEQLIGNVIVGTARDGLVQLYTARKDPRGAAIEAAAKAAPANAKLPASLAAVANLRTVSPQQIISVADDPTVSRALRYQALMDLSWRACTNPMQIVTGPSPEARAAFERARTNLARFPGELAFLDLIENVLIRPIPADGSGSLEASMLGAASGVSALFVNPRLQSCTVAARYSSNWR